MRLLLIAFAVVQLVTGLLLWLTPGFFHDEIGPFGPRNDHYMGDVVDLGLGPADFVSLSLGTVLVAWMLKQETAA
jgi:hypothetical protein